MVADNLTAVVPSQHRKPRTVELRLPWHPQLGPWPPFPPVTSWLIAMSSAAVTVFVLGAALAGVGYSPWDSFGAPPMPAGPARQPQPVRQPQTTDPAEPQALRVSVGSRQLTATWDRPAARTVGGPAQMVAELRIAGQPKIMQTCTTASDRCQFTRLVDGQHYAITAAIEGPGGRGPAVTATGIPQPAPLTSASVRLRLDAQAAFAGRLAAGQPVTGWPDQSAPGRAATPPTGDTAPTLALRAGAPVVRFTPPNRLVLPAGRLPTGTQPSTVVVVAAAGLATSSSTCEASIFSWGGRAPGSSRMIRQGCPAWPALASLSGPSRQAATAARLPTEQLGLVTAEFTATAVTGWLNGDRASTWLHADAPAGSPPIATTRAPLAAIGGDDRGEGWRGDLAEVIVFDRTLTSSEQEQIEAYLQVKWRLTDPQK